VDVVVRTFLAFGFVYLLTRVMGRRELSSLEPTDLLLLIVVGDLVQQGITQNDLSLTGLALAIGTFGLLTVTVSYAIFRFRRLRRLLEGHPLIVVQDGRPVEKNLRRERITPEEIAAEARLQQLASLDEVKWAVLETNGKISFIPVEKG
jgi:uncharacterized membrane protein YcaP (DUF421 family)